MKVSKVSEFDFDTDELTYTAKDKVTGQYVSFGFGENGQLVTAYSADAIILSEDTLAMVGEDEYDWQVRHKDPRLNGATFAIKDRQHRLYDPLNDTFGMYGVFPGRCLLTGEGLQQVYSTRDELKRCMDKGTAKAELFSTLIGEVILENDGGEAVTNISEAETATLRIAVRYEEEGLPDEVVSETTGIPVDDLSQVMREAAKPFPEYVCKFQEVAPEPMPVPGIG